MKAFLIIVGLLAAFGLVGEMDYQDEVQQAAHYQQMVCDGHWPNYKDLEVHCNGY